MKEATIRLTALLAVIAEPYDPVIVAGGFKLGMVYALFAPEHARALNLALNTENDKTTDEDIRIAKVFSEAFDMEEESE